MSTIIQATNIGLIASPQFLSFERKIIIPLVPKFRVDNFFKTGGIIPMHFGDNFKEILEKCKDLELSLEKETLLNKFLLKKDAWDTEIHSDFEKKPVIPVKIFLPLLKALLEAQPKGEFSETGLDNSGKSNIFNVDLTEINPLLGVFAVHVCWGGDWGLHAHSLEFRNPFDAGHHFFSLATL